MSKGMRLSFYGIKCSVDEAALMTHMLGYDSMPIYGWGKGGYRNYCYLNRDDFKDRDRVACERLATLGIMEKIDDDLNSAMIVFRLTDLGLKWFRAFKRGNPHADFYMERKRLECQKECVFHFTESRAL